MKISLDHGDLAVINTKEQKTIQASQYSAMLEDTVTMILVVSCKGLVTFHYNFLVCITA